MLLEKVNIPVFIETYVRGNVQLKENPDYFGIKDEYLQLISSFRENVKDQFIGGMPVQIEKDCVSQLLRGTNYQKLIYGITLKINGVRHLLYLSRSGILYLIDRKTNFYYFKRPDNTIVSFNKSPDVFLFDGELIFHKQTNRWEFLIFDVLFYRDAKETRNWMNHNYFDRLYIMDLAVNRDLVLFKEFDISLKMWFWIESIKDTNDIYNYVITQTNKDRIKAKRPIVQEDGLILQPFDGAYVPFREWNVYNNIQFKWKPYKELTIDFKIKYNKDSENIWELLTSTNQVFAVKQPDGQNVNAIIIPTKDQKKIYKEGDVVECRLKEKSNPQNNIFIPIQIRADKTEGNSLKTCMSTMDAIKNRFSLDELKPAIISIITDTKPEEVLKFYSQSRLILCTIPMFFMPKEISSIQKIYDYYFSSQTEERGYELEFRVYPYTSKKEDINKFTYFYFLDFLMKTGFKREYNFSIDILLNDKTKDTYRSTYSDYSLKNPINQVKRPIDDYKLMSTNDKQLYNNLTLKLNLSIEEESKVKVGIKSQLKDRTVYNLIRVKHRWSFYFKVWRIDITRVITSIGGFKSGVETYEIECEFIGKDVLFDDFINSMNQMYKIILLNTSYC
jgi:hypothetical protein